MMFKDQRKIIGLYQYWKKILQGEFQFLELFISKTKKILKFEDLPMSSDSRNQQGEPATRIWKCIFPWLLYLS